MTRATDTPPRQFAQGDRVISPDTSRPWEPMRVTEAAMQGGIPHIRIHRLAALGWMRAACFLPVPADATYDTRTGRWVRVDGVEVTPKRADLPINRTTA